MADAKISALTNLTAADPTNDMIPIVDVSDTPPASGNTKRISINNILSSSPTASGALTVTGLVTAGSATITGAATVGTTLGVTGVSTLASAVVTGALTVDTSTLVVDPTNNCVGILTATPDADRLANTGLVIGNGTSARGIMFYGTSSSQQNLAFSDTAASQQGLLQYDHSVDQMKFFTSGALQATLTTTELTIANGNVVMGTSGKGIDFSATANGSGTMTSELLNDYEEGTFTATLTGLTTGPTIPVTATGRYTKIGREVKVSFFFSNVSTVGASGSIRVTGLPFTSANDGVGAWGPFSTHQAATFTGYAIAELGPNTTIIEFPWYQSAGVSGYSTHNAGTGRYIGATLMYNV